MTWLGLQFGAAKILGRMLRQWSLLLTPFEGYPDFYGIKVGLYLSRFAKDWAI